MKPGWAKRCVSPFYTGEDKQLRCGSGFTFFISYIPTTIKLSTIFLPGLQGQSLNFLHPLHTPPHLASLYFLSTVSISPEKFWVSSCKRCKCESEVVSCNQNSCRKPSPFWRQQVRNHFRGSARAPP